MSAYLTIGQLKTGGFKYIEEVESGRTNLTCPFCKADLIAVRGAKNTHHFRHDGETCNESLNELPRIPGWDHFHLSYPMELVDALKEGYQPSQKNHKAYRGNNTLKLERNGLISPNTWSGTHELTEAGLIIVGGLTLTRFSAWMRNTLKNRIIRLSDEISKGHQHSAHHGIEAYRQQHILNAKIYLFELTKNNGDRFHKIGRTERSAEDRLSEVVRDMKQLLSEPISGRVLKTVECVGHVEHYALHRYRKFHLPLGSHREYLQLPDKILKNLKSELTRLANDAEPFDKAERFITTGRWRYEEKRLKESKEGISRILKKGGTFGRPKGTTLSQDQFLEKHSDVVSLITSGSSINEAAAQSGKSRSTVKRVRNMLKEISNDDF